MGYFEFRAYLEGIGRPNELETHVITSQEAWRCYMHDLVGTDSQGRLTPENFEAYRALIEPKYPLEADLIPAGIPVLPRKLAEWRRHNKAFEKLSKETTGDPLLVPAEELQLLAWESGEVWSQTLCEHLRLALSRHNRLMTSVRSRYRARHRFEECQQSRVEGVEPANLARDASAALWFSDRPRQVLLSKQKQVEESCMTGSTHQLKCARCCWFRSCGRWSADVCTFVWA